jgi:hypothetical protein
LRERGERTEWLRSVEWTLGSDKQGPPHIHVWFFGPWLLHKRQRESNLADAPAELRERLEHYLAQSGEKAPSDLPHSKK